MKLKLYKLLYIVTGKRKWVLKYKRLLDEQIRRDIDKIRKELQDGTVDWFMRWLYSRRCMCRYYMACDY